MARSSHIRRLPCALAGFCAALSAAGCGGEKGARTLLDAAETYAAHEAVFESIRGAYPGPYGGFTRIPARDPAAATAEDKAFLNALRKNFPVEHIDLFPIGGAGGGDEIDVVLNGYNAGDEWRTISVVYFSAPLVFDDTLPDVKFFKSCGAEALGWLEAGQRETPYSAFCRINGAWHAYQRVD